MTQSWRRDPAVMATELDTDFVLLDPRTRRVFDLNGTGAVVWSSIEDGIDEVVDRIVERFGVDEDTARSDVDQLVTQLVEAGLVVPGD